MSRREEGERAGASLVPPYETGVFLGLNAVENAVVVANSPRCSFVRGLKVFVHNDLASTVYRSSGRHRLITTEWEGLEDALGAGFIAQAISLTVALLAASAAYAAACRALSVPELNLLARIVRPLR